jgi:hypothetical protein
LWLLDLKYHVERYSPMSVPRRVSLVASLSLLSARVWSQATDEIDAAQLGERGVVLESPMEAARIGFAEFLGYNDGQGIGDLNGDGLDDIALSFLDGVNRKGFPLYHVMVIHGRPRFTGKHTLAFDGTFPGSFVLRGMDPDGRYEVAGVNLAGDINGDGISDLVFGHYQITPGEGMGVGTAFLVYGSPRLEGGGYVEDIGRDIPGTVFFSSDPSHQSIGFSVANVGDVNGDGSDDLAIAAPSSAPQGREAAGVVFVLTQIKDLPASLDLAEVGKALPGFVVEGTNRQTPSGYFVGALGAGVQSAGDFNADGFSDLFMTATELRPRSLYLLRGGRDLPATIDLGQPDVLKRATVFFDSGGRFMGLPRQAAGVHDVNGDGVDDIMVGAPKVSASFLGPTVESVVYLFYGREEFPTSIDLAAVPEGLGTAIHGLQSSVSADYFGAALAPAGDLNHDGVPDLLIGASRVGGTGEAYAVLGRRDLGSDLFLDRGFDGLRIVGETERGALGRTLASAGDFNGDGARDIFLIAPQVAQSIFPGPARAYVIYGTGTGAPPFSFLGVEPLWGPIRGGTEVSIRGSGFAGVVAVHFGDAVAQATLVSGTEIRAIVPPGPGLGPVDVSVVVQGQTRVRTGAFEYTPNFPEFHLERLGEQGFILDGKGDPRLGNSVVFLDLNGDGRDELVAEGRLEGRLAVVVVHGGPGLPSGLPAFEPAPRLTLVTSLERDGGFVGRVGDLNGDGIEDLGLMLGPSSELGAGPVAYVVFGRRELPARLVLEVESTVGGGVRLERGGPLALRRFSAAIAATGDLTGDGIDDVVVSFPEGPADPVSGTGEILFVAGRRSWPALLDLGSPDGFLARLRGPGAEELLGGQLLQAGDVNGDGVGDLLASSAPAASGETVYIIYGSQEVPRETDVRSYIDDSGGGVVIRVLLRNSSPGNYKIAAPGDVDGDGYADVLLGFSGAHPNNQGVSLLIHGAVDLPRLLEIDEGPVEPGIARVMRVLGEDVAVAAGNVGPAGDFDGDGYDEFVIGASLRPPVEDVFNPGRLFLLLGGKSLPETIDLARLGSRGIRIDGITRSSGISVTASNTGDLNGDGSPDFSFVEADKLYVIYGLPRVGTFVRGDPNADAIVNLTDAVFILEHLFRGGPMPLCLDAADTDDTGAVDVTDAVYLLRHLFQGTEGPPLPYPDPGPDSTADALDC